jgi:hypothetical protein
MFWCIWFVEMRLRTFWLCGGGAGVAENHRAFEKQSGLIHIQFLFKRRS